MSFAAIAIKTAIPVTAPAATTGALTFSTIEDENWIQIIGDASAGSGSLYLLRWNADLAVWHPYMGDKPIAVDSAAFNGLFSAYYPFPKGEESFVLYDPTGTITATASAARTGSPLVVPVPASSGAAGGATEAKQDTGNASLVSILGQLDAKTSTLATAAKQDTSNTLLGAGLPAALVGGKLDVNLGTSSITLPVSVTPSNTVSAANSSTTPLAGAGTFTGTGADLLGYAGVEVFAFSDVAGTLYLEYSTDNSNWDLSLPFTLTAGVPLHIPNGSQARYYRTRYVNGGSAQASFRLQTLLLGSIPAPHTAALAAAPLAGSDAILTQSELVGLSSAGGGTYVPVKVSPSGAVQVGGTTDQGTGAAATVPWSVELSDGAAFYTGAKTGQFPTTLGQTTKAASLSVAVASDQTVPVSGTVTVTPSGTQDVNLTKVGGSAVALGQAANATSLPVTISSSQTGTAGSAATQVLSVQGIASMTPVQVSQATAANLNATVVQGAGSGSAATFWYSRITDGTNTMPTMDAAARSGYQRVTDGTNTTTVKAASTVPAASDTALVVSLSPNSKNPVGSSFSWFSTATGSTIKSGAGVVRRIVIGSNVAGTVTLYDNTTNSGTVICSVTSTTSTPCNTAELNAAFSTGLHCVTTGSGISVTVVYD